MNVYKLKLKRPKLNHVLFIFFMLLGIPLKGATVEKTIKTTVGSTFTVSPWGDTKSKFSSYTCASTSCRAEDASAFTINIASTTTTSYRAYSSTWEDGYYCSYKIEALKAGTYIINGGASCYNYNFNSTSVGYPTVIYHVIVSAKPVVTSISIPSNLTLSIGDNYTFSPVIVESGANTTLTWSSNNPNIVSVDNKGCIKAVSSGIASVRCVASNGVAAECLVTVNPVLANSITLNHQELTIEQGQKATLTATVLPANTTNSKVEWSSSDPSTALVSSDGIIVGLQPGWSIVTATTTDGSAKSATCMVEVLAPTILAESITMNKSELTLTKGETENLQAIISPNNVSNNQVEWKTDNDCVSIDKDGNVTAIKVGNATVTATTKDGTNLSCQCNVSVKERDVTTYDNIIYFEEVIASFGSTYTLPLMLNNKADITAIQFDLSLPEGIDVQKKSDNTTYDIRFNEQADRTDANSHNISSALQEDGTIRVICYSTGSYSFSGNDGAVLDIPIVISEDIALGEHRICINNIVLTDKNETKYTVDNYSSLINIISATLGDPNADGVVDVADIVALANHILGNSTGTFLTDAADLNSDSNIDVADIVSLANKILLGNAVRKNAHKTKALSSANSANVSKFEIAPFVMTAGQKSNNLTLDLYNDNEEFTAFQLDLSLPEGLNIDLNRRGTAFNLSFNTEYDRTDATYHTLSSAEQSNGDVRILCYSTSLETFWGSEGSLINIPVTASADILPGVYSFAIKNIVLTKPDETKVVPADYYGSIIIGDGGNVNDIKLYGTYSEETIDNFSSAFASNTNITSIDLSEISIQTDVSTELTTGNPNTLFYLEGDNTLGNSKNIIKDGICENLTLTDGYPFHATQDFTAVTATYARNIPSAGWCSLCLPFAANTPTGVNVERFVSIDTNASTITFEKGEIDAYKPCIFYTSEPEVTFEASNTTISSAPTEITDGLMIGTLSAIPVGELTGMYALRDDGNGFGVASSTAYSAPFRAFVCTDSSASLIRIVHDFTTNIESLSKENELQVIPDNGYVTIISAKQPQIVTIHDLDGRILKKVSTSKGITTVALPIGIYIINNQKICVK